MQVPLLRGVIASEQADFLTALPVNLEPVPTETGIAAGFLRSAMGARAVTTGPGIDRGGIVWNGVLYRVMGSKLVSISSTYSVTVIGDVGNDGKPVSMDFGFGRLAVGSAGGLYYWNNATLVQVTDPDLGNVVDMIWMSGYYISTDGTSIVVTQLSDPLSVNPLKYGSAEEDPDPIVALYKLRGELLALGTESIQFYNEIGGSGFPFQPSAGATIPLGCIGTRAKTPFLQSLAFVGSARNEMAAVHVVGSGSAQKISIRVVDDAIARESDPSAITMETRVSRNEQRLYVHLSQQSFVYLPSASAKLGEPVWYRCASGRDAEGAYRPRNAVFAYGQWICGDVLGPSLGALSEDLSPAESDRTVFLSTTADGETYSPERACATGKTGDRGKRVAWRPHRRFGNYLGLRFRGEAATTHFDEPAGYSFNSTLLYNKGNGGILHSAELIGLPGRGVVGWSALECEIESLSV